LFVGRCAAQTLATSARTLGKEATMALRYLGKDPESDHGQSPTVWEDRDSYVVQGWRITDAATLAVVGDVPPHETVVRVPKRLMMVFPEVNGGGGGSEAG
jgi:hypothetical protein